MANNPPLWMAPHIHVPFDSLDKYLSFLKQRELNIEIYFGSRTFDDITDADIINLKSKLDYNPAISIHGPFMDLSPGAVDPKVRELTANRFLKTLGFGKILNSKVIVFHSGYDRWKYDNRIDIWLDGSLKTWMPVEKQAADMGIKIAIENIFEEDPEHLKLLSKEINSEYFGICFDTGHFNLFSKLPLKEWLGIIKPYIKELHLHDNSRYEDEHLAIGEGDFDFATLFNELKGIECVHTLEAHSIEDANKSLEKIKEYY